MLKIKQTAERKVYVTSDFHYNHNPKWTTPLHATRGYATFFDMNEDIIKKVNDIVRPNDILFNLGDLSLNCDEFQCEDFLSKLNCQNIYLLWGNHNNPIAKIYRREVEKALKNCDLISENISPEIYPFRYKNVVFFGDYLEVMIDGRIVDMMHYPIDVWNHMKDGAYMLCGHSHYNLPETRHDWIEGLILDCGWEGKKAPYSFDEIVTIMRNKRVKAVDHHVN